MIAVEQQRIDRVADFAGRRFDECEPQIARTVLDSKEVASDSSFRRQDENAGRMRELLRLLVPDEAKARGFRQTID